VPNYLPNSVELHSAKQLRKRKGGLLKTMDKSPHDDQILDHHDLKKLFGQTKVIESTELFMTKNEVLIRHAGEIYRLRVTKNGKLILTK